MIAASKKLLDANEKYAPKEVEVVQLMLEQILCLKIKQRSSHIGSVFHPVLEDFFRKKLLKLYINCEHEKLFNKPFSYHRIDSCINIIYI